MNTSIQQLAQEYKLRLQALYGDDLVELVLFGSYARGDFHEESDIDFALVLRNKNRPSAEIFNTSPIASELSLKYGLMISTLPVSVEKKRSSMQWVYRNIRTEGIIV
jgi:predicted nucleotidyltransferase